MEATKINLGALAGTRAEAPGTNCFSLLLDDSSSSLTTPVQNC